VPPSGFAVDEAGVAASRESATRPRVIWAAREGLGAAPDRKARWREKLTSVLRLTWTIQYGQRGMLAKMAPGREKGTKMLGTHDGSGKRLR